MRKMRLDPDALRVDSFAAGEAAFLATGTVKAQSFVPTGDPFAATCQPPPSAQCSNSPIGGCGPSGRLKCFNTGVAQTCVE
jgi:hypothetical protein